MTADVVAPPAAAPPAAAPPAAAPARAAAPWPVAGVLADGTPFYVPAGQVAVDGDRVICHLCGRAFRSVPAHLASHGWTKDRYCETFGLERSQSLEGQQTRKLRAASLSARLVFDRAIRDGSAAGRERGPGWPGSGAPAGSTARGCPPYAGWASMT